MEVTEEGLLLVEYNPEYALDEIKAATEANLLISDNLKPMV
jgi:acetate CoA/acetoacetate CoA-transferase beta subunit